MYRCSNCKNTDKFELMFSDDYKGNRKFLQKYNNRQQIEITIDGHTFVPTLDFMNQYAVCKYCGQIYTWEYE
ncbi:MAG: hypothetical protein ACI37S_08545 [Candidatus Gastranaerophilaceae bacterium]